MRRIILIIATLLTFLAFASPAIASPDGHAIKPVNRQGVDVNNFDAYIAEASGALCVDTGGVVQGNYALGYLVNRSRSAADTTEPAGQAGIRPGHTNSRSRALTCAAPVT